MFPDPQKEVISSLNSTCCCFYVSTAKDVSNDTFKHIWAPKVTMWGAKWIHAELFSRTSSSFVEKCKLCFGPRRRDRIRVLAPCFRPLGFLGASGGKAFSQDHPKGYINWKF